MKRKSVAILLCLIACFSLLLSVSASARDEREEPCSLTLVYRKDGQAFGGQTVRVFRFAEWKGDGSMALCGAFSEYSVKLGSVASQEEWREIASTLAVHIESDEIAPFPHRRDRRGGKGCLFRDFRGSVSDPFGSRIGQDQDRYL